MRVAEIAALLDAPFEGEGNHEIFAAAPLESAADRDISFVGNRRAADAAGLSGAGCLLVPPGFPEGRTLIRTSETRAAFARVIALLYPAPEIPAGIHPSAVVAADAEIREGASIGPHSTIGPGVRIGAGTAIAAGCVLGSGVRIGMRCSVHPNVSLYEGVTIGDRVILHSGCVLGTDGFGFARAGDHYEKFPQIGRVEIGNDVEIGANSCVDRAALGVTSIGDGTKLDNMVHVGHNCRIGRHVVIAAQTGISGGVVIEDYAVIGGQVGIGDKARIESGAILGSGCGVLTSKVVRKGQVVWGTPARPLKAYLESLAHLARLPALREEVAQLKRLLSGSKS